MEYAETVLGEWEVYDGLRVRLVQAASADGDPFVRLVGLNCDLDDSGDGPDSGQVTLFVNPVQVEIGDRILFDGSWCEVFDVHGDEIYVDPGDMDPDADRPGIMLDRSDLDPRDVIRTKASA